LLKNRENRYLAYLLILTAIIFFILGVVSLKSGVIRRSYDFIFAINYHDGVLRDFNSDDRIDTIEVSLSKKNSRVFFVLGQIVSLI